jgi:DNA-binding NarL/FixJ family response regulator
MAAYVGYRIFLKRKHDRLRDLLSQREKTIVQFILEGKTNKEIANTFNIELSTVKTHVNNVYAKLKISERKELQKYEDVFRVK